jgi:hypothetical protein
MKKQYSFIQEAGSFLGLKFDYDDSARKQMFSNTEKNILKKIDDLEKHMDPNKVTLYGAGKTAKNLKGWTNNTLKKIDKTTSTINAAGGIVGGIGGGVVGNILSRKLFKVKQRNQIKQIILSSDSPEDCIEKLKQLGTSLALNYCDTVNKVYQKYPNGWKGRIANSINIRNVAAQTVGTIGGTYAGNRLGYLAGNKLGQHMSNTYADKLINKIDSTMKDPGPVPINFWAPDKHQHPNIFDV